MVTLLTGPQDPFFPLGVVTIQRVSSMADADGMSEEVDERTEALRGVERQTLELIADVLTLEEWGKLLAAPLGRAVARGNRDLAQKRMH